MDDMLIDSDHLSVQPLTELLKGLGNLDQAPSQSHGFRKLRPEVIDMQRIKDVGQPQPVSSTSFILTNLFLLTVVMTKVVRGIVKFPPPAPSSPLFRPRLDALSPPYFPLLGQPKPANDLSSRAIYSLENLCLSPT